ncbi:FAR1-related sequence 5 [Actinidia rufa]|uniref:FAR1-related sequence 5 n=1 Tax=Actinidia rufa TaxID=165716 RepID=A0A7J0DMU5_9ERIC|nr:FAR1-related sequence 5 [Actinidia rufa]
MESEVIEFDIGLGGGGGGSSGDEDGMDGQHPVMDEDMADSSPTGGAVGAIYIPEGDPDLEPYENMEFESEEAAKAFYNSYARRVGFSTRRTKDREIKRPRTITRVGCKASLSVKIQDSSGKWVVSGFVKEHNHELVPPDQVHCLRSHRQISGPAKTLIDTLQAAGMGPRKIMSALIKEYGGISKVGFTENEGKTPMINGRIREDSTNGGSQANICSGDRPKSISQQFSETIRRFVCGEHAKHGIKQVSVGCSLDVRGLRRFTLAEEEQFITICLQSQTSIADVNSRCNTYWRPYSSAVGFSLDAYPIKS